MANVTSQNRIDAAACVLAFVCVVLLPMMGCGSASDSENANAIDASKADSAMLMRLAMQESDWRSARKHGQRALITVHDDPTLFADLAQANAMLGEKREAASLMATAVRVGKFQPDSLVNLAVQAAIDVGDIYLAIELLQEALQLSPDNHQLRRTLLGFLGEAERPDLMAVHFRHLIRQRKFDAALLIGVTDTSFRRFSRETIDALLKRNPADQRIRLGAVQGHLDDLDFDAAEQTLREILERHPNFSPAKSLLGQVLVAGGRHDEIPNWYGEQDELCRGSIHYWMTLGDWAASKKMNVEAARAYWEAACLDGNSSQAWRQLSGTLRRLDESQAKAIGGYLGKSSLGQVIDACEKRVAKLLQLRAQLSRFAAAEESSQSIATEIASTLHELGRDWESEAWAAVAIGLPNEKTDSVGVVRERAIGSLRKSREWINYALPLRIDLSKITPPVPSGKESAGIAERKQILPQSSDTDGWHFADATEAYGVVLKNKVTLSDPPLLMHSLGAGGSAFDFELDGNCDLLFGGAGGSAQKQNSAANTLLRNVGGTFRDVTDESAVGSQSFTQGIAVGDFNEDGFPDFFVANLGSNQLYLNNGDGTFAEFLGLPNDPKQWSTCGVFADLDGDGISDLLSINYCDADSAIDKPCLNTKTGEPIPCHPVNFPARSDRILKGASSGKFQDVTASSLSSIPQGRGLGVLAGKLDGQNVSVFVANDMTVNQLYTVTEADQWKISESATVRGIAVDGRSQTQASMGIASGDFDGDGDLDFYVTGFAFEYNIYYEQDRPGFWFDNTARQGLVSPTLASVGFGTEAVDINGDGIDELIVTNGHIGDFGGESPPQAQKFQAFHRTASGRFAEIDLSKWATYFARSHIGRALWTLDVNNDGRKDFVVTHENEQPRLFVNESDKERNRISLQLVGTDDARDGTGAIVRFETGGRKRALWSLAGDGYMCSNERLLQAGLGNGETAEDVTVTWADGTQDKIGSLPANARYVIVQGQGEAFRVSP